MKLRTGTKNPHTLYDGDRPIGCVFDPADGVRLVEALKLRERVAELEAKLGAICNTHIQRSAQSAPEHCIVCDWMREMSIETHIETQRKLAAAEAKLAAVPSPKRLREMAGIMHYRDRNEMYSELRALADKMEGT